VEFMVQILKQALEKAITVGATHHVTHQVTHQVIRLLEIISGEMTRLDLMHGVELKDRVNFRVNYLEPALLDGLLEMTQPDAPKSPTQKYRLTAKGKSYLKRIRDKA
jgi:ATP-dependent DNA helicase RecG